MDVIGWLAQHTKVRTALVWEDASGAHTFTSWPASQQQELAAVVNQYLSGGTPSVPDSPPNVHSLGDGDLPTTAFAPADAWGLYRAYAAHSLAMEISQRFPWRLDDYAVADLARLLSSKEMFRLVNGAYRLDDKVEWAVPAPPHYVRSYLEAAGVVRLTRGDTVAGLLEWCRDHLDHAFGPTTAATMQAVWQYRGWPPVSRVLGGTVDVSNPGMGIRHWTAGCWGTSGFLRSVLRALNVPATSVQRVGHSLPHFTAAKTFLSHGDDPYSQLTRAVPEITGHDLLITKKDFDARFGSNPTTDDVGYRVWQLALGEVWRSTWTKGWTAFVPLSMSDTAHYLAYKSGNGRVDIDRLRPGGQGVDTVWSSSWTSGWSAFVPFTQAGRAHYLAYKVKTGRVAIDRVRPDAQGVETLWEDTWTKGWTSLVPFTLNGAPHYLAYKVGTGDVAVDRIRPDAHGVDTLWRGKWTTGWTSFAVVPTDPPLLFSIKASVPTIPTPPLIGRVTPTWLLSVWSYLAVDEIRSDATIHPRWAGFGKKGWSLPMAFDTPTGPGSVLMYNGSSGALKVVEVTPTGVPTSYDDKWTSAWTTIVALRAHGRPWYLTYKKDKGTVTINHLCG